MLDAQLHGGLASLGITVDDSKQKNLLDFLRLMEHWNRRINLTAIRNPSEMIVKHLLDSLSVQPHLQGSRLIDVGTGAGLPGVPLAIINPEKKFTLLDSNGKKTRFLVHVKSSLKLLNVDVVQARVEEYRPDHTYDAVLSRAFASLDDMIGNCKHLLDDQGVFLAMKGQVPEVELTALAPRVAQATVIPLHVPGLEDDRCLVRLHL